MIVAWKICIFVAISLDKIFSKIYGHPILWLFLWSPIFQEKMLWHPAFFMTPYSKENDSPLSTVPYMIKIQIILLFWLIKAQVQYIVLIDNSS